MRSTFTGKYIHLHGVSDPLSRSEVPLVFSSSYNDIGTHWCDYH